MNLVAPLREISTAVSRVSAGDMSQPIPVVGGDVLAQLAESHNRLAADADRRNRQLGLILAAVESAEPRDGVDAHGRARRPRRRGRHSASSTPSCSSSTRTRVEAEERIPGVSVPIRAELRAGDERIGLLLASLPATQTWERADQTLLDLYASEIGVAIRNAELFNQVQDQNQQLRQLSEVKDDFLRGVSHNLQTPLTSIRSNADALGGDRQRPEADDHLGPGRPADADGPATAARRPARVAAAPTDRRRPGHRAARPARMGCAGRRRPATRRFTTARRTGSRSPTATSSTRSCGPCWTTPSSTDRAGSPSRSAPTPTDRVLWITVSDDGRGFEEGDRAWLFGRFERGAAGRTSGNGSGLGLYVSRALMRGMGGDLVLDDPVPGRGATFRLTLPGEPASEA